MQIVDRNIILTFDELRVLLYSQGFRQCEGVYMPEKRFTPSEVVNALKRLEESGILTVGVNDVLASSIPLVFGDEESDGEATIPDDGEVFYIRDDLKKMLEIIGRPDATEVLSPDDERHVFCYYSEDGIVTSERYRGRRDTVRLAIYSPDEFIEWRGTFREEEDDNSNGGDPDNGSYV